MTQEQIIAMARECGVPYVNRHYPGITSFGFDGESLTKFAKLVRNKALEDAAKHFNENTTVLFWGSQAADEINAMKDKHG